MRRAFGGWRPPNPLQWRPQAVTKSAKFGVRRHISAPFFLAPRTPHMGLISNSARLRPIGNEPSVNGISLFFLLSNMRRIPHPIFWPCCPDSQPWHRSQSLRLDLLRYFPIFLRPELLVDPKPKTIESWSNLCQIC